MPTEKFKSQKLKIGIAGFGVVGKRRRQFIDQHPKMTVVAVCDQNYKQSGTLEDGVRFYPDYQSLLQEKLDVLFVSLPNYLAAEVTRAGLKKGLHVFCEKPPGNLDGTQYFLPFVAVSATQPGPNFVGSKQSFSSSSPVPSEFLICLQNKSLTLWTH